MAVERADADARTRSATAASESSPRPSMTRRGGGIQQFFLIALGIGATATQDFLLKFKNSLPAPWKPELAPYMAETELPPYLVTTAPSGKEHSP